MNGPCGPTCRFVYPDLIKSYFIENVPWSFHNCTCRQKNRKLVDRTNCKLWSQQVQVPSRLFQKPASRPPLIKNNRQFYLRKPGLKKTVGLHEILRNSTVFQKIPGGFVHTLFLHTLFGLYFV